MEFPFDFLFLQVSFSPESHLSLSCHFGQLAKQLLARNYCKILPLFTKKENDYVESYSRAS